LVDQAEKYLRGAYEAATAAEREEMRANAERTLKEALERGELENPAVWYFLGRAHQLRGDLAGMDSSFDRAEALAAACKTDMDYYRELSWVQLINSAVDSLQSGAFDGARALLTDAAILRPDDNLAHYYLARLDGDDGDFESALEHFRIVLDLGPMENPERQDNYITSVESMGEIFTGLGEWDSAAVYYEKLRELRDGDVSLMVKIAESYANAGDEARAMKLYEEALSQGETMDAASLFATGRALYLAEQFSLAADALRMGVAKNPYALPAMYDLANVYRSVAQSDDLPAADRAAATTAMHETVERILEADPLSAEALRLLAAAHQMGNDSRATDQALARIGQLPVEMEVYYAESSGGVYNIQGRYVNQRGSRVTVPQITFEFLTQDGTVVETRTSGGDTVDAKGFASFSVTASAPGVVGYRYKVGS
jgi:tetratricopeptide (TPR) repeat protein